MALLALGFGVKWIGFRPSLGFLVELLDVGLELRPIDPPDTSASYLDRRETPRSNERIDLRTANVENLGNVFEGQKPRFGRASSGSRHALTSRGRTHTQESSTRWCQILGFETICFGLRPPNPHRLARS